MRRVLIIVTVLLGGVVLAAQTFTPLTGWANLAGKTDNNGSVMAFARAYGGTVGPLTNFANLPVRTDSNGSLAVTLAGGTATPDSVCLDGANQDTCVVRDAANVLALRNGANAQTLKVGPTTAYVSMASANLVTVPTDATSVEFGGVTRFRSSSTITPATAGVGNCGAAFLAAALTADCVIATLPAGQKLVGVYADVTAGFTCSGTCSGTKVMQAGTSTGGTQVLAAGLNVAVTGTFGLADADLGSGMTRAAAIQGGLMGSWSTTTPISVRFTSGTGNWGNGAATFVNAGSVKFTLITEQVK